MLSVAPKLRPVLDPEFLPAALWQRAYRALVAKDPGARPFAVVLERKDGSVFRHESRVLAANHPAAALTLTYAERLLKFLLWMKGGPRVLVAGADEIAAALGKIYAPSGARAFDCEFMGVKIFDRAFSVEAVAWENLPETRETSLPMGRNLDGCRIGFDLGGSDRKASALIDGEVVFSEEIAWDPYFQKDPTYHIDGVHDSLKRAAAHLPRVDAIGGSAAGVYVNNEVRARAIYESIGVCFGYAIAHYANFYEVRNLLVLGRVTSGEGGEIILERAGAVLRADFPELAATIQLRTPDEKNKRHGQATAAASLPTRRAAR